MNTRYSVIIPAYNSEKTIRRCLDSLLNQMQQRNDTEVILVNDGSSDGTDQICREYENRFDTIKYIPISKSGVSAARNIGLKNADGFYIAFVDSDDYVTSDYFRILDQASEKDCDLVILNYRICCGGKQTESRFKQFHSENATETALILTNCLRKQKMNTVYGKMFKNSLIRNHQIDFPTGLQIGEDKVFMVKYMLASKSLQISDRLAYIAVWDNEDSLTRSRRDDLCESVISEHKLLFEVLEKSELDDVTLGYYYEAVTYSFYRSAYSAVNELNKYNITFSDKLDRIRQILREYENQSFHVRIDRKTAMLAAPVRMKLALIMFVIGGLSKYYRIRM